MNRPSKRRRLSPKPKDNLLHKYKIKFEGPNDRESWPQYHSAMFTAVQNMKNVYYTKYAEGQTHSPQKSKLIEKAKRLADAAVHCGNIGANEPIWREKTESVLLSQAFMRRMECEKCKLRPWLPEYHSMDFYPVKGQGKESLVALCKCIENCRPGCEASSNQQKFAEASDSGILADPSIPEIRIKRPDRTIGFQESPSLHAALQKHPDLESSLVKDADHIKFPFLILEAKSEGGCRGFRAVEKQTAFPIKRLVDLQKTLRKKGKEPVERALVWFLAFIGNTWRVYAGVPNGDETRIIELWEGSIRKHDGALQLCIIVDLICDWAWNILHREIIQSLSVEQTTLSTKESDHDNAPSSSERKTVIRNASEIFFSFRHLALPESSLELTEILKSSGPGGENITANASKLLDLFNLEHPIQLARKFVSDLETMWTSASSKYPIFHGDKLLFTHISFRSYFRPSDFHTVREISCITASHEAITALQQIIGKASSYVSCLPDVHVSVRLEDVLPLATGSGQDSMRAAARNLCLNLCATFRDLSTYNNLSDVPSVLECHWAHDWSQGECVSNFWSNIESRSPGNPMLLKLRRCSEHRSSELRTLSITNEFSYRTIREFLYAKKREFPCGAAILKTPEQSLQPLYPQYCLAVFGGQNLDDRFALGNKLSQLIERGWLFEGKSRKEITGQDHRMLHDWQTRLQGEYGVLT